MTLRIQLIAMAFLFCLTLWVEAIGFVWRVFS